MREPSWWTAAREIVGGLTNPRAATAVSDRGVARLLNDSACVTLLRSWAGRVSRASEDARVTAAVRSQLATWRTLDEAGRVRAAGSCAAVAAAIALGGYLLQPRAVGPLGWLVPALALVVGLAVASGASAIVRARRGKAA